MRNMLLAMMALAVCCVQVEAATPADATIHDAAQAVQNVVAPAVPAQPVQMQQVQSADVQVVETPTTAAPAVSTAAPVVVENQVVAQPQQYYYHQYRPQPKKQNVFQKLLELERRKNAWLRKTFLNK